MINYHNDDCGRDDLSFQAEQLVALKINPQMVIFLMIMIMTVAWLAMILMTLTFLVTTSSQISSRLGWGEASASKGSLKLVED